jgi:hypothetical protein
VIRAKTPADALQEAADRGDVRVPAGEHQHADAHDGGSDRRDPARAELVERDAGHQAEGGVSVVEEPDQGGEAGGRQVERRAQLRQHHRRGRAQHVLDEVVDRDDQPGRHHGARGDRSAIGAAGHHTALSKG